MKKILMSILLVPSLSAANPYFRVLGHDSYGYHPSVSVGACADPVNVGHSQQCTVVNVIGHSHSDGYVVIPGEDWSLLGAGYGASGTGVNLVLGPSINLAPIPASAVLWLADRYAPNSDATAKLHALYAASSLQTIDSSFGPAWAYDPVANKGYFRLFCGASWKFK